MGFEFIKVAMPGNGKEQNAGSGLLSLRLSGIEFSLVSD